jgi:hypothetical protein
VKKNRDAFVDVTNGVPREEALIASATMTHSDADDQVRAVYKGQWVRRDDLFVKLHPLLFTLPALELAG